MYVSFKKNGKFLTKPKKRKSKKLIKQRNANFLGVGFWGEGLKVLNEAKKKKPSEKGAGLKAIEQQGKQISFTSIKVMIPLHPASLKMKEIR